MDLTTILVVLVALALACVAVLLVAGWWLARQADAEARDLAKRIVRLRWRAKLRLVRLLAGDAAIPLWVRGIPPALVIYLASPIDIIPDFIPVLGQLDDIVVLVVGIGLLSRLVPRDRLIDAIERAEAETMPPLA